MSDRLAERNKAIVAAFAAGNRYADLGRKHGLDGNTIRVVVLQAAQALAIDPNQTAEQLRQAFTQAAKATSAKQRWRDVLPPWLADAQAGWERNQSILRARKAGQTLRAIGKHLNLSPERIRQIEHNATRAPIAPIERYFAEEPTDLAHLCKQHDRKQRKVTAWQTLQVGDLIAQLTQQNKRLQADLKAAKTQDPNPGLKQRLLNQETHIKDLKRYESEAMAWIANAKTEIADLKRTLAHRDDSITTRMVEIRRLQSEIDAKHKPYIERARAAEAKLASAVKSHNVEIERKLRRRQNLIAFIRHLVALLKQAGAWTPSVESYFDEIMQSGE